VAEGGGLLNRCRTKVLPGVRIPHSPPSTDSKTSDIVQESSKSLREIWGFRLLSSNAAWWKPKLPAGIFGGILFFKCGYIHKRGKNDATDRH
jgi:hypothetical protein